MTKAEQARPVAWRLKTLRHAEQEPQSVRSTCHLTAEPHVDLARAMALQKNHA